MPTIDVSADEAALIRRALREYGVSEKSAAETGESLQEKGSDAAPSAEQIQEYKSRAEAARSLAAEMDKI